jgi:hypothetical protein
MIRPRDWATLVVAPTRGRQGGAETLPAGASPGEWFRRAVPLLSGARGVSLTPRNPTLALPKGRERDSHPYKNT